MSPLRFDLVETLWRGRNAVTPVRSTVKSSVCRVVMAKVWMWLMQVARS